MKGDLFQRIRWGLLALLISSLFLYGCHKKEESSSANTIHLNLKNEPPSLDPRKGADIISSRVQFLLFEGLVELKGDYSIALAQAESFKRSEDELTYTFFLRDTYWSNGQPVIAYDFEKAWKDVLDPQFPAPNAYLFYPIKNGERAKKGEVPLEEVGIRSLGDKVLEITLEKPTPYFLELIAFCSFFPVCSSIDQKEPNWAYDAGESFVSNGPFVLASWKHHDEIVLYKNSLYWNQEYNRPNILEFSMIGNEMTAFQLFEKGELDLIGDPLSPLPIDVISRLKETSQFHKHPLGATTFITFNVKQPPFHNEKIRKAFSYAIDRRALVSYILDGDQIPAFNAIPPVLKGGVNHLFFQDSDPVLARRFLQEGLKEEGLDNLPSLTFFYAQTDQNHQIAQALQQQWKQALDVDVVIENLDFKILLDKLCKREYCFAEFMWAAQYSDPMNILERFRSPLLMKNYPGWENADYAALLDASFYAKEEERSALLTQAEEIFLKEMPICPLYHWEINYALPKNPRVTFSPVGQLVFPSSSQLAQGS